MFSVTKQFKFCAAHSLGTVGHDHKCSRMHGHNYKMDVTFANDHLDEHGFVIDTGGELVQAIKAEIDERWDHQFLNFTITNYPTVETLCKIWFDWISACDLTGHDLVVSVKIEETDTISAEYKY